MQLKALIPLALAGLACSNPTVTERDLPTITNAINSVNGALQSLDSSIKSFQGAGDVSGLQQKSQAAVNAINQAASDISNGDTISITDALSVQTQANSLVTQANTTVNDVIAKKSTFDQFGVSGVVYQQLQQQQAAGKKLSDAIVSKVPSSVQSVASQLTGQVTDILNRGVTAYQGSASETSGAGAASSTAAAATSATSAAAATSAPAAATTTTAAGVTPPAGAAPTGASSCAGEGSSSTAGATTPAGTGTGSGGSGVSSNCPCLQQLGSALMGNVDKRMVGMGDMLDKRLERLDNIGYMLEKRYMQIEKRYAGVEAKA